MHTLRMGVARYCIMISFDAQAPGQALRVLRARSGGVVWPSLGPCAAGTGSACTHAAAAVPVPRAGAGSSRHDAPRQLLVELAAAALPRLCRKPARGRRGAGRLLVVQASCRAGEAPQRPAARALLSLSALLDEEHHSPGQGSTASLQRARAVNRESSLSRNIERAGGSSGSINHNF